jgi:hypothetical protein
MLGSLFTLPETKLLNPNGLASFSVELADWVEAVLDAF